MCENLLKSLLFMERTVQTSQWAERKRERERKIEIEAGVSYSPDMNLVSITLHDVTTQFQH